MIMPQYCSANKYGMNLTPYRGFIQLVCSHSCTLYEEARWQTAWNCILISRAKCLKRADSWRIPEHLQIFVFLIWMNSFLLVRLAVPCHVPRSSPRIVTKYQFEWTMTEGEEDIAGICYAGLTNKMHTLHHIGIRYIE